MRKFLFFLLCCFFLAKTDFSINLGNEPHKLSVISNGKRDSYFDYDGQNSFSCQIPDVFHEKTNVDQNYLEVINNDQQNSYTITLKSIGSNKNIANPAFKNVTFPKVIGPGKEFGMDLHYNCLNPDDSNLFYTLVDIAFEVVETSEILEFSYIKLCKDRDYIEYKFDYSLIIVVGIAAIFTLLSLRISNLMALKKKHATLNINFLRTFLYFFGLIPLIVLFNYYPNILLIIFKVLISILAFMAFIFFTNQFLGNILIRSSLYRIGFKVPKTSFEITLFMIIGAFLGFAFIIPWGITNDWVLSNIITIILFIAAINVLKVNKFKNGLFLMIMQIVIDVMWMIFFNYLFNRDYSTSQQYRDDKQYNDFFGSKLTLPLKIECVFIKPEYNVNSKCSWISISNLIIPCLLISYFNRYDKYVNATIYSVMSILAYLIGIIAWTVVQSKIGRIIPLSIYINTLISLLCGLLAFKRNEHYEIWNGVFPDMEKEEVLIKSHDLMEQSNERKRLESEKGDKIVEGSPIPEGKSISLSVRNDLLGTLNN